MQAPAGKTIAIFDFDHTLIEGESFWTFLGFAAGWPRTILATIEGLVFFAIRKMGKKNPPEEMRTFLKDHLLMRLLAGGKAAELSPAVKRLRGWMKWNAPVHKALLEHRTKGHQIVIASGGLDLYLLELLEDLPHDAVICTQIGVENGIITGEMLRGNCVRLRKAELVAEYLEKQGPFTESWGYGNLPHDLPMLNLLKHRIIV